jgi:hypothetical protein
VSGWPTLTKPDTWTLHQTQSLKSTRSLCIDRVEKYLRFVNCVLCVSANSKCALLKFLLCTVCPLGYTYINMTHERYIRHRPLGTSEVAMSFVCKTELQFIDCILCVCASRKCALLEFLLRALYLLKRHLQSLTRMIHQTQTFECIWSHCLDRCWDKYNCVYLPVASVRSLNSCFALCLRLTDSYKAWHMNVTPDTVIEKHSKSLYWSCWKISKICWLCIVCLCQ